MRTIGIDLGKVNSQLSERDEKGGENRNERFPTTAQKFRQLFADQPKAKILVEACTISHWVAALLRQLGHEVVVADPNFKPMYIDEQSKRKKTDKRDARILSWALCTGNWRPAHERSEREQVRKSLIDARARQVKARTQSANGIRGLFAYYGVAVPACEPEDLGCAAQALLDELPKPIRPIVKAQIQALEALNKTIGNIDRQLELKAKADPHVQRLMTAPGVGTVVASAFVAVIDDPQRFDNGHELASFLGLCPGESSSGEKEQRGHITKLGPKLLRSLLVQAAWGIWRSKSPEAARLKSWAQKIAARRNSKRLAATALARKLAGILLAMWKNEARFEPNWKPQPRLKKAA